MTTLMQDRDMKICTVTATHTLCFMSLSTLLRLHVQRELQTSHVLLLGSARGANWRVGTKLYEHYSVSKKLHNRACPSWCVGSQFSSPAAPDPCNLDATCHQSQGLVHLPPTCIWTLPDHLCGARTELLHSRCLWRLCQQWPHHFPWSRSCTIHQHAWYALDNTLKACCLVHVCIMLIWLI